MTAHALPFRWTEWGRKDALDIAAHVLRGEVSAVEVAEQARNAIRRVDPALNASLELFAPEEVGELATAHDITASDRLDGVPIVIKDLGSSLAGRLQEQGSALFRGHRTACTDPLLGNLLASGISIVGRSACSELGMAFDTTTDYRGLRATRNPWDKELTPGGSSGGSAALVAAGAVPAAHGTDGAGSIRIPAALTGLIGLKVTRGLLPPPWGFNEYTNPGMVEGFLTRSVRDTAALLDAGSHFQPPGNSFIARRQVPEPLLENLEARNRALRIGYSIGPWGRCAPLPENAAQAVIDVARQLAASGHHVEEIDDQKLIDWSEFWTGFTSYWIGLRPSGWPVPDTPSDTALTPMVRGYLDASHTYDKKAIVAHQNNVKRSSLKLASYFERYDVLLSPVFGTSRIKANGILSGYSNGVFPAFIETFLDAGRYTILANETGLPAISVPVGFDEQGLPQSIQLHAPWNQELLLLRLTQEILENKISSSRIPKVHVSREPLNA